MSGMTKQLKTVRDRDGFEAMLVYATRTLAIYRECARPQRGGKKHFAHVESFRPHFVRSIFQLRAILRSEQGSGQ